MNYNSKKIMLIENSEGNLENYNFSSQGCLWVRCSGGSSSFKDMSISGIIHDLKTPITSIIGFTEFLKTGNKTADQCQEYCEIIEEEAQRMLRMINQILKNSKEKVTNRSFSLQAEIENTLNKLLPITKKYEVQIKTDFESDLKVDIDKDEIHRILVNIIENAIKYSKSASEVKINTKAENNNVFITVENEGIDFLEDECNKVFEKFYRGKSAAKSNIEGSGLGLFVVKSLVNKNGGKVKLSTKNKKVILTVEWPQHTIFSNINSD